MFKVTSNQIKQPINMKTLCSTNFEYVFVNRTIPEAGKLNKGFN